MLAPNNDSLPNACYIDSLSRKIIKHWLLSLGGTKKNYKFSIPQITAHRQCRPVARSGKGGFENNKSGPKVGVDHQKGVGAGGGCAPSRAKRGSF